MTSSRTPRRRAAPRGRTLRHWLTFSTLALELDLPVYKRRWLQRQIIGTDLHEQLGIQRADTLQTGKPMPVPPKSGKAAWLIRRDLFVARRDDVINFLFPADQSRLG